jgi:hypothetical protein
MKNLYVIKNSTVEKQDYLASHFFLVRKRDTSLKKWDNPIKNGTSGHPVLEVIIMWHSGVKFFS